VSPARKELSPNEISMFWHYYGNDSFDPTVRENNQIDYTLFTFDILNSLSERERDFLLHARLGHMPRKKILQMIKNGTTGIGKYSGKFKELCKPCMQAKQRAENHGHEHIRHPNGKPGEHLHSDLAVLSTLDLNGNKYVLTVVDEISQEIVVALLKRKTAEIVCNMCKKIQLLISARSGNKLLTWQFDRGTEFLNSSFESWLKMELGVIQRFSNIEHPWENGKAERSFQTLFALSRSMLKHADLPDRLWGKAILHSVYLSNRSPSAPIGGIAPLQFRTREMIDLTHLRVFGSPAQIFVRPTIRTDNKLSDRSISGTFVGVSDKGNGYIFLIKKLNTFVEIDSKDAKFNETFSQIRARQGKLTTANDIEPDLRTEDDDLLDEEPATQSDDSISDNDGDIKQQGNQRHEQEKSDRPQRLSKPRDFLLPGTISQKEIDIRKVQYANMCVETSQPEAQAIYILDCMDSENDEESKLMKELELMNACTYNIEPNEVLLSNIQQSNEINLSISDPKSQGEIDRMLPKDAARFNDATVAEVKVMKHK
jgi:hypothetical protein